MIQELEERQQAATAANDQTLIAANAAAIFDDGFSFVAGNPEGALTVVEFLDYQCGYCRRAHPEIAELLASDGDIRLVVKEMPILGPGSELAARAALATLIVEGPEAYATLHDRLMRLEGEITDARLDALLTELGHDPAAIRARMHDPEVDRRLAGDPGAGRDAGDLRHADIRRRRPDAAAATCRRKPCRRWSPRCAPPTDRDESGIAVPDGMPIQGHPRARAGGARPPGHEQGTA